MAVPFLACMAMTAQFYALPPRALPAIQLVEGGYVGSVSPNTDGSDDLGVMQVNTLWVVPLARAAHLTPDAVRARLIGDACFNIAAAGIILRTYLIEAHFDLMTAIGFYHSHTPALSSAYQGQVRRAAGRLFGLSSR